jgi:hypothetical protein
MDLFRCESILLKSLLVLVITDQFTRHIIGFGVHADDVATCKLLISNPLIFRITEGPPTAWFVALP